MQTLIVNHIEEKHTKDGSKSFFIITDNTGASFSLWEPIGMIKPGCVLEADIEVKGKYANIKNFKITSQPTGNEVPPGTNGEKQAFEADPKKMASIERQVTAKIVFANMPPPRDMPDGLARAEYIYWWISQGTIPPTMPPSTPEKSQPATAKASPPSPAPKQADEPPVEKKAVVYKTDPATIKDKMAFQKACHKDFGLNDPREITRELNISSLQDISDWGESYRTIAAARD